MEGRSFVRPALVGVPARQDKAGVSLWCVCVCVCGLLPLLHACLFVCLFVCLVCVPAPAPAPAAEGVQRWSGVEAACLLSV